MILEEFEKRIERIPESGCWIWIGNTSGNRRYGCLPKPGNRNLAVKAHRYSWVLYKGEIPNGFFVLHKCDVTFCVNPDHLWLGTQKDNILDCVRKGRFNHIRTGRPKKRRN